MADKPTESWIRDAIFNNPRPFLRMACRLMNCCELTDFKWAQREFRTVGGLVDLFFWGDSAGIVVEVKRELIDEGAVAQCLRYVGALSFMPEFDKLFVTGFCVAPRISSGAKLAACVAGLYLLEAHPDVALREPEKYGVPLAENRSTHVGELVVETASLPVLSGALEGGRGGPDVFRSGEGALDRHAV